MDDIYSKKPEECAYSFTQHRACEFFPCHKTNLWARFFRIRICPYRFFFASSISSGYLDMM